MLTRPYLLTALFLADDLLHACSTFVCRWRTVLTAESWVDLEAALSEHPVVES